MGYSMPGHLWLSAWLLLCLGCTISPISAQPSQLVSAYYSYKEANLLGTTYQYAIFEANFDQDLYYLTDTPCPCVDANHTCPLSFSNVAQPVDETLLNPTVLRDGVWYYGGSKGTAVYYKFEIPIDQLNPCPVIKLEVETEVGTASAFISAGAVPTVASHTWAFPYNSKDHMVLCPFSPLVSYGTYYIAMVDQLGSAINSWGLRLTIESSITCPVFQTPPTAEPSWINNGEANTLDIAPLTTTQRKLWFSLPPNPTSRCIEFSAYVSGRTAGTNGDIYVSTVNRAPSPSTSSEWFAATSNDDTISFLYCLPDSQDNVTFYMGIYNRASARNRYLFTAWASFNVKKESLLQLLYAQSAHTLNFGGAPKLVCDQQVFTCRTPPDPQCEGQGGDCCYLFRSLPPTRNPNPLMPWNSWDESIPQVNRIPWNEPEVMVPGKLAWALYISRTTPTGGVYYSYSDPATCRVELGNILVTAQSQPVTGTIRFTPKPQDCKNEDFSVAVSNVRYLVDAMSTIHDYDLLSLQQLRLNILANTDDILSCSKLLHDVTTSTNEVREWTSETACFADVGSVAWGLDPCCNRTLALTSCCAAKSFSVTSSHISAVDDSAVSSLCSNPDCAKRAVETLVSSETSIRNTNNGCQSQFLASASPALKSDLESPPFYCFRELLGEDLRGLPCSNSSDCLPSSTCDQTKLRCNHTLDDVTDCVAQSLDPTVARSLYNLYGFSNLSVSVENTVAVIKVIAYEDQCVGENSLKFREAYHYHKLEENCQDRCIQDPVCIDTSCTVRAECNSTVSPDACNRYWLLVDEDNTKCENYYSCSWFQCPEDWTTQRCNDTCTNSSLSQFTCIDCSGRTCVEVSPAVSQATCELGRCSLNSAITDMATCAALGGCSITCPTCNTESGCTNHGFCSDAAILEPILNATGLNGTCVIPFTYSIDGVSCPDNTTQIPSGCVDLTYLTEEDCIGHHTDNHTGHVWETLATNRDECIGKGSLCKNEVGVVLPLDPADCALCAGARDVPYYSWTSGIWKRGDFVQTLWVEREFTRTLSVENSLNYPFLQEFISTSVADVLTYPFITEALCRYTTSYTVSGSLVCDCTANSPGKCFSSISNQRVGANRACPGLDSDLNTRVATLHIFPNCYSPTSDCQLVEMHSSTASEYELDSSHSLSSAIFQSSPTNSFWVVKRSGLDVAIGQIVSGAVNVTFGEPLINPALLCIVVETDISIASIAKVWALAFKTEEGTIQAFPPSPTANYTGSAVCDYVRGDGTYFATKLVENYQTEEFDSVSNRRQARAGAALYFITVAFAALQGVILIINWQREKIVRLKIIFVCIVALNALVRGIYLVIPSANFVGKESIQFIIFELPSFLFFSVYLAIIYLWLNVTLRASQFRKSKGFMGDAEAISRDVFIGANIFLYAIFIVFMFLISILPTLEKPSVCFLGAQNSSLRNSSFYRTKLAYWCIVAGLCVLVSIGFIVGATLLLRLVLSVERTGVNKHAQGTHRSKRMNKLILISIVAAVCTVFLLIRSALFLYAAITSKPINVIVFVLLEVIPSCGLLYYLRPYFLMGVFKSSKTSSRSSGSTNSATSPRTNSGTNSSKYESREQ